MTCLRAEVRTMQFADAPHVVRDPRLRKLFRLEPIEEHPPLIRNLTLQAEKSEVIFLLGPSGVGKSTLLRILAGLETQFDGDITLAGEAVKTPSRRIQVVFQDNSLLPWFDVERNIAFAVKDEDHRTFARKTTEWLQKVGLEDKAKSFPKTLSGGEASRVAFARAFISPPQLLLLDEPVRTLDEITIEDLQNKLLQFAQESATTVILVSHSIDDAIFLSDRVIVLAGRPLRILKELQVPSKRPRERENKDTFELALKVKAALRDAAHGQSEDAAAMGG